MTKPKYTNGMWRWVRYAQATEPRLPEESRKVNEKKPAIPWPEFKEPSKPPRRFSFNTWHSYEILTLLRSNQI
jgi:hypothetical protein